MKPLKELFNEHPNEVGMTYFGHLQYALTVTARLFVCSAACLLHAFLPFLFTNTTSTVVAELHEEFTSHGIGAQTDFTTIEQNDFL